MGRWMSPDFDGDDDDPEPVPYADLEDPQSMNLYAYESNSPVTRFDPDGHLGACCTLADLARFAETAEGGILAGIDWGATAVVGGIGAVGALILDPTEAGNDPAEQRMIAQNRGGWPRSR